MAKIMIQGTGSSVGKSVTTAALLRIFKQDGYKVVPYKSQNMSNNSFITLEGEEMGRAQVLQAYAAGVRPRSIMNPILIKPSADAMAQVIVNGKVHGNFSATEYEKMKPKFKVMIKEQLEELEDEYDIIVIEGAGSPAEINLRKNDVVNMGLATMIDCPVLLVGDIDKGGVFASLYGTIKLLQKEEQELIKGTIINKFRGDINLLLPGIKQLEDLTLKDNLGVIPYYHFELEEEDGASFYKRDATDAIDFAVLRLPHLSNHSDFEVLKYEKDVSLRFITKKEELGNPDVLFIPGNKNTIYDLEWLKKNGIFDQIQSLEDTVVFGICGGYQMLGKMVNDKDSVESKIVSSVGFDKIPMITDMEPMKVTKQSKGYLNESVKVYGYEIHMGKSRFLEDTNHLIQLEDGHVDGYVSPDKKVYGTYMHGVFDSPSFREYFINPLRKEKGLTEKKSINYEEIREETLDKLADLVRENLDMDKIYKILNMS
ncbi:MAG: cobyric acid synthase [Bacillota bacterium]|nr:cobyric acid synthase [Bacillota bacterium]